MTRPPMAEHVSSVMAADVATDITAGGSGATVGSSLDGSDVDGIAADPATDVGIDTADDVFAGVADFPTLIQPRSGVVMMRSQKRYRFLVLLPLLVPPNPRPRPTRMWISARLLHPPSLLHANGRLAVATTGRPRMATSVSVGLLLVPPNPQPRPTLVWISA